MYARFMILPYKGIKNRKKYDLSTDHHCSNVYIPNIQRLAHYNIFIPKINNNAGFHYYDYRVDRAPQTNVSAPVMVITYSQGTSLPPAAHRVVAAEGRRAQLPRAAAAASGVHVTAV